MVRKNKLNLLFLIIIFFSAIPSYAQLSFQKEFAFYTYLQKTKKQQLAQLHWKELSPKAETIGQKDTLRLFKAFQYFDKRQFDSCQQLLISPLSIDATLQKKQFYYGVLACNRLANFKQAQIFYQLDILQGSQIDQELVALLDLGNHIMCKQQYKPSSSLGIQHLQVEWKALSDIYIEQQNFKPKSKAVAVLLSTLMPGLGKGYVGDWRGAVSTFAMCGINAAQAVEAYRYHAKILNARTLIFGSIFTVYYLGSIYGSAKAVKRRRYEFKQKTLRYTWGYMYRAVNQYYPLYR